MRIFLRVFSMLFDVKKTRLFCADFAPKKCVVYYTVFRLVFTCKNERFFALRFCTFFNGFITRENPCRIRIFARFCYHKIAPLFSAIFARKRTLEKRAQKTRVFTREYTENIRAFYGLIFDEKITAEIHRKKTCLFYIVFCRFFE